jgi:autotransporter-associated beta strand protein
MVKGDALLELAVSGLGNNEGFQEKGKAQIEIRGGALHQLSGNQFTDLYRLKVNGGTLAFAPGAAEGKRYNANWKDANTYIGGIEYSNGAKTVGASPRMGLNNTGSVVNFSVSGNLPCRAEHGIDVVGVYTSNFIAFDIDDVTGNGETDFTMTGAVLPHSDGHRLFKVVKTGEGTLEFLGANDYTNYPTYVRGGTLRLGASGVMHEKMNLSLEGGSFAVAAGTSNILGRLAVSADADITVESAAELSFADSSDVAWGNDLFRLNIFQSEGASVRFGENASSLTQNQLRRIRLNGRTCKIDENGYLRQRMGPVIVIR